MSNTTMSPTNSWNDTEAWTAVPSSAPTVFNISPDTPTYYAPSVSQVVLYVVITSLIVIAISFLNRRSPNSGAGGGGSGGAATTNDTNTSSQDQVNLVKSMTPEERKEYVTNFLRTQKFVDDHDQSNASSVSFRVAKSSSSLLRDDDDDGTDLESNIPNNNRIPSSDKIAPSCAICLDRFKNGEDICCAQNQECPHEFHLECLFPWLLKSQDCPCCRRDYLSIVTTPTEDTIHAEDASR